METNSWPGTNLCQRCGNRVQIEISFSTAPPLLALEFSGCNVKVDRNIKINVDGDLLAYNLAGIVYFKSGESHFVSNLIMPNNQVWYYDGLINGGRMAKQSNTNLSTCIGGSAVLALYIKDF
jgi:hypothetical protein